MAPILSTGHLVTRRGCALLGAIALVGLAVACGGYTSPSTTGTLAVMMTDSPFTDAKALLVTFSEVSIHSTGGAFVTLPFTGNATTRTCDLKKLTSGAQDVLGSAPLAAGHYTQIRLTVSSATIYFDNPSVGAACATTIAAPAGSSAPVNIPSGQVILNREFDLTTNMTFTFLLDFHGDASVTQLGGGSYQMSPVISIVSGG